MDVSALHKTRKVSVKAGSTQLVEWLIPPDTYHHVASPPFRLPAGLAELTIESRGAGRLAAGGPESAQDRPYSLRVARVSLYTDPKTESIAIQDRQGVTAPETKAR
jgi:hypothetical protein